MYDHGRWNDHKCDAKLRGLCAIDGSPPVTRPDHAAPKPTSVRVPSERPSQASPLSSGPPTGSASLVAPQEAAERWQRRDNHYSMLHMSNNGPTTIRDTGKRATSEAQSDSTTKLIDQRVELNLMQQAREGTQAPIRSERAESWRALEARFDRMEAVCQVLSQGIDALLKRAQAPQPSPSATVDFNPDTHLPLPTPPQAAEKPAPTTPVSPQAPLSSDAPAPTAGDHPIQAQSGTALPPKFVSILRTLLLVIGMTWPFLCKAYLGESAYYGVLASISATAELRGHCDCSTLQCVSSADTTFTLQTCPTKANSLGC